jgi:hypothetical protein
MCPGGIPIKRNQDLVLQCLNERDKAFVLYLGTEG